MQNTGDERPAHIPSPINIFGLSFGDFEELFKGQGKEKFRAHQVFKWIYEKRVFDPAQFTDLAKNFRAEVEKMFSFELPPVLEHRKSTDGTQKFLFDVGGGLSVEAVLIPADDRQTLCVSSEVGCNIACQFCYTGKQKLKKRLSAAEIVGQYLQVARLIEAPLRVTNIVFMGMGEPLDNTENVFKACEILIDDRGINFSRKKVTVSTSGLIPQMPMVAEAGVRLAVSLNAPNDEIRNRIMPINKKYPLKDLMEACREHARTAKDRVTFEYVLLKDVNDDIEHARQVYNLVKSVPCKLNLIPFNEHPDSGFSRPVTDKVYKFQKILLDKGIHTTIRRTMGRDIFAACGQLTSLHKDKPAFQNVTTGVLG